MTNESETEYLQVSRRPRGPIVLADPDPRWANAYLHEEHRLRDALGERMLQVEHVGSTSVPGLAAKPILDIVLVVADPAREDDYVPDLGDVGYVLHVREPGWHQHRLLKRTEPAVNLHVFGAACPEVDKMLVFRDRLRARPQELALYETTKRELAARTWSRVQDYADAKSAVVEEIIARAGEVG